MRARSLLATFVVMAALVHAAAAVARPNIVLVVTDDQRWDTVSAMPRVTEKLVNHGVTFTNGFVSNSLCCPSRASILTGRYSHST
ncbi:MAG TPA: sulfatase-like hydrolase/transferase, partial [Gaiellaceae bacterium]